jgi:CoA:oxalate CoA-transferase
MSSALEGIKILDFSQIYSGPLCTLMLRDLGAEVIKIERAEVGDPVRSNAPATEGLEGGIFIILNRGKKGITINLKSEKGRNICRELAQKVDVVVQNFSPGTMDKLGLGSEDLCKLNPRLIYASISAFGQTGPSRNLGGYDPVAQAMGGLMSVTGFPDSPPTRCGISIADFTTGIFTALAITAAVVHRMKTGEGQTIDISLQDCIWMLTSIEHSPYYFIDHKVPQRMGNGHPVNTPSNTYPAKNGWVLIATGALDQIHRLYRIMGREDLINTPLGLNQKERVKYRDQIDNLVTDWTRERSVEEITKVLGDAEIPCSMVPSFDQVCHDPQLLHREMIIDVDQVVSGKVKTPGSVFKLSKTPGNIRYPAPFLGQHNLEVLGGMLGYSEADLMKLASDDVV